MNHAVDTIREWASSVAWHWSWAPQKPPGRRVKLSADAVAAIPIIVVIVGILILLWQLLGQASIASS